ncbi:MAG: hypothetical protein ABI119_03395 [Gemmatimonadaceae bacterium]
MPHRMGLVAVVKSSIAWATMTTVGFFALFHQATGAPVPVPLPDGGLLPVTLGGWVGMLTGVFSITAVLIHAWKNPSERVAADAERNRLEMEKRIDKQLALLVADMTNAERDTEKRVAVLRETDEKWDVRMRANETAIAVGQQDRTYLRTGMDDLKRALERIAEDNKEHNLAVLDGITKIAGGVRGMMPLDYNPRERDKER